MQQSIILFLTLMFSLEITLKAQEPSYVQVPVVLGIEQTENYLPLLTGKKVALVVNQTSVFPKKHNTSSESGTSKDYNTSPKNDPSNHNIPSGFSGAGTHLVDSLLSLQIQVTKIFSPEHGFRGNAEAGATINNSTDPATGIPVISLYGKNKKPTQEMLKGIDVVVFDLQDVGTRFYTYISTLQYLMEACAEAQKAQETKEKSEAQKAQGTQISLIILDRTNPNGFYVDGPVLDTALRSFVGMQAIPIVHGMTVGEYAQMLLGENLIKGNLKLTVIPMQNYNRNNIYPLAVAPSPNLSTMNSILFYPTLCLFEGTNVSVGRGTPQPFASYGFPKSPIGTYSFTPVAIKGVSENPPYKNMQCKGFLLDEKEKMQLRLQGVIQLDLIIEMYKAYPDKDKFFTSFFDKLAGTKELRQQIRQGKTADEIRASWQPSLEKFKTMRKKYLLYEE